MQEELILVRERKEWFSKTLKSIRDAVITTDPAGRVLFMNPSSENLIGWDQKDAVGKPIDEIYKTINEETGEHIECLLMKAIKNGMVSDKSNRTALIGKNGKKIFVEDTCDRIEENNGNTIGFVLVFRDITDQIKAQDEQKRRSQIQAFSNKLLQVSLENISLEVILELVIDNLASIPWLELKSMGGIWLVEDEPDVLVLKAHRRLPVQVHITCNHIPFGKCICGRAASSGDIEFTDHVGERHEIRYNYMTPHGHYCVPLVWAGKVIGIINMFLEEGHSRNPKVEEFLLAIAEVVSGIIPRKKAEERLKEANIELKRADELKTQFLSLISHELRTPITPITAQLQMILTGYFGELTEKQKNSLEMIQRNTTRLDGLIGDVLDISKLEAGVMKFNMVPANLNTIVENAVEIMKIQALNKNLKLTLKEEKIPEILIDKDRITQVMMNLLNNAIKFTDPGGDIKVELSYNTDNAIVKVKDSGIGIKKEDIDKLFKPFQQLDPSLGRKYEGTGIGLTICNRIIKFHGGKIWVESDFGNGSTFNFTIPYIHKTKEEMADSNLFEEIRKEV